MQHFKSINQSQSIINHINRLGIADRSFSSILHVARKKKKI